MRASLASTVVLSALKLVLTSDALAGVPAAKVVKGPTGAACAAENAATRVSEASSDLMFSVLLMLNIAIGPSLRLVFMNDSLRPESLNCRYPQLP